MFSGRILAGLYGALTLPILASAASVPLTASPPSPILPSIDPFYNISPSEYIAKPPGTPLRIRHAPGNLTTVVANSSAAYVSNVPVRTVCKTLLISYLNAKNILYRTTDSHGAPSYAVTTLFIPSSNHSSITKNSTTSLLSIQIAYNTANVDASPSYALYALTTTFGIPSTIDDLTNSLGKGLYVNVPDFEGPHAAFGLGLQEGHATLDSIRAVLSSDLLPRALPVTYAMWGYSGGSVASDWAAELQLTYAPELRFAGMAVGGLVPDFTHAIDNITVSPYAGLIPLLLLGSTAQDVDARAYLVSRLQRSGPYNASAFLAALKYDTNAAFAAFANQDIFKYFVGGRADLDAPVFQRVFNMNWYQRHRGVPRMPVFVYKAIHDEFTTVKDTDALVKEWCEAGVSVRYDRNTVGGHIAEITNGRQRALDWLDGVFEGVEEKKGCIVKNVTVKVTDSDQ
jgi:hypothetical protein